MSQRMESPRASLKDHFADLPDPRSTINRRHLLLDVVVISMCAVVAGADGPAAIAVWAQSQRAWLAQYLELPHGLPGKDCIRRVLMRLNPTAFQKCFAAWLGTLVGELGAQYLNIDGKTLRRSHDKRHGLGALHLVSVWASERGLTLAQVATAEKSNEITAIPLLLNMVDVKGAIITIDAMGCQTAIAGTIVEKGGDYVLPVKGNQGRLEQATTAFFEDHLADDFARLRVSRLEAEEQHHGRLERRCYIQVDVPKNFDAPLWRGLKTLGLVVRTREINGVETGEVQCYISSLKRNVKRFAKAVRGHWGIENSCHWVLDMTFREDEQRTRERTLGENLAWLRRFALGLLKQHPDTKTSLAMKRRQAGWNVEFLAEVLFGQST
jgi:predicted transposase YbfD/YdcC